MGPHDLAPNTVPPEFVTEDEAKRSERNWFYNSLSIEAKERFLDALERAADQGLSNDEAWASAVRAAELTYVDEDEKV